MKKVIVLCCYFCYLILIAQDTNCLFNINEGNYTLDQQEYVCFPGDCANLSVDLQNIKSTSSYEVNSISFTPPVPFNEPLAHSVIIEEDDWWSEVVEFKGRRDMNGDGEISPSEENIPYDFCFMGENYVSAIIGSNGVISFDVSDADTYNSWPIPVGASLPSRSQREWNDANIFGACHDIDFEINNSSSYLTWEVKGEYPCRFLVVKYQNIPQYRCNDIKSTQMIVLYENSNIIEVYIKSKPVCYSWNDGLAIIGIQNSAGTVAYSPPGRNPAFRQELNNEAWQFRPNGAYTPEVRWFQSVNSGPRTSIGNTENVRVCINESTEITAEVTYNTCGTEFTLNSKTNIAPFDISLPEEINAGCADEYTLTVNNYQGVRYQWYLNGQAISGANSNSYTASTAGVYGLRYIYESDFRNCDETLETRLLLAQEPVVNNINEVYCNTDRSGSIMLDLTDFESEIADDPNLNFRYYASENDAENDTNEINSTDYQASIGINSIYVKVSDNPSCYTVARLEIEVVQQPWAGLDNDLTICQSDDVIDLFDVLRDQPEEGGSWAPELSSGSSLFDPMIDTSGNYTYTVQGESPCTNQSATINVTVNPMPELQDQNITLCDENFDNLVQFDLNDYIDQMVNSPARYEYSFHETSDDAWNGESEIGNTDSIYFNFDHLPFTYYVRVENSETQCANVAVLQFSQGPKVALDEPINLSTCAPELGQEYTHFDLNEILTSLNPSSDTDIKYYTSFEDMAANVNPIAEPENFTNTVNGPQRIWVRGTQQGLCSAYKSFEIKVQPLPYSEQLEDLTICEFNDTAHLDAGEGFDGYQWYFQDEMIEGANQSFYDTETPGNYSVLLSKNYEDGLQCQYLQGAIVDLYDTPEIVDAIYNNGSLQLIGSGLDAPFRFNYNGGIYSYNDLFELPAGLYSFNIMSSVGCEGEPIELPIIYITNIFTPNGDGVNDYWNIKKLENLTEPQMQVFDRYGKRIFFEDLSQRNEFKWDGKYQGRSLPSSTYWYLLNFKKFNGKPVKMNGYVIIKNRN